MGCDENTRNQNYKYAPDNEPEFLSLNLYKKNLEVNFKKKPEVTDMTFSNFQDSNKKPRNNDL